MGSPVRRAGVVGRLRASEPPGAVGVGSPLFAEAEPAAAVLEYSPKNGDELNGTLGCGKSPQKPPMTDFMYAPQIAAGNVPPSTLPP